MRNTTRQVAWPRALLGTRLVIGLTCATNWGNIMDGNVLLHFQVKVDFCDFWFMPTQLTLWREFRDALNATGKQM